MLSNLPDDELFYMHTVHLSMYIQEPPCRSERRSKICHGVWKNHRNDWVLKFLHLVMTFYWNWCCENCCGKCIRICWNYSKLMKYVNSGPLVLWSQCYYQLYLSLYNYVRYKTKFELKIYPDQMWCRGSFAAFCHCVLAALSSHTPENTFLIIDSHGGLEVHLNWEVTTTYSPEFSILQVR